MLVDAHTGASADAGSIPAASTASARSSWARGDHGEPARARRLAFESEARGLEQRLELLEPSLSPTGHDEHVQVGELRLGSFIRRSQDALDDEQHAAGPI